MGDRSQDGGAKAQRSIRCQVEVKTFEEKISPGLRRKRFKELSIHLAGKKLKYQLLKVLFAGRKSVVQGLNASRI